ncbi:hypothetical protein CDAR_234191 [Caerostris darwini]|uniref:Uncharacterized protein n=1 Tax=Caerostris darwini TaxID=1538125 RepID=A0AAV4QLD6_9ARAC|nr:hypothetical protein CDAR_234191 [Caerostris darwini]
MFQNSNIPYSASSDPPPQREAASFDSASLRRVQKGLFSTRNRLQTVKALFGGMHVYTKGVPLMPQIERAELWSIAGVFQHLLSAPGPPGLVRLGRVAMAWAHYAVGEKQRHRPKIKTMSH